MSDSSDEGFRSWRPLSLQPIFVQPVAVPEVLMRMIASPDFEDSLFLFGDNCEEFSTATAGTDEDILRQFNRHGVHKNRPRSAGIPVGRTPLHRFSSVYELGIPEIIEEAIIQIMETVLMMRYKTLVFNAISLDGEDLPALGGMVSRSIANNILDQLQVMEEDINDYLNS